MSLVENFKIGNNNYPVRDINTFRSLTPTEAAEIVSDETYNGEPVESGELFTGTDGTIQQAKKETLFVDKYDSYTSNIDTVSAVNPMVTVRVTENGVTKDRIVRAYGNGSTVIQYTDDGLTWETGWSETDPYTENHFRCFCVGDNGTVYALVYYTGTFDTHVMKSENGGKTWENVYVFNNLSKDVLFFGYLKTSHTLVFLVDSGSYQADNTSYYSTDYGETWSTFDISTSYGSPYRIGNLDDDTFIILYNGHKYTTTSWTSWIDDGKYEITGSSGFDQETGWDWKTRIRRIGNYLYFHGGFTIGGAMSVYSTNGGTNWTAVADTTTHGYNLAYGNIPFILVDEDNYSTFYAEGTYIAIEDEKYYVSNDLVGGWQECDFIDFDPNDPYLPVVYGNKRFVFSAYQETAVVGDESFVLYRLSYNKKSVDEKTSMIIGNESPTVHTVGRVGELCIDLTNKKAYICFGLSGVDYIWEEITFVEPEPPTPLGNFVVHGSPTIVSNELTGATADDYIVSDTSVSSGGYIIEGKITTGDDIQTEQIFIRSDASSPSFVGMGIKNGKFYGVRLSGTREGVAVQPNTTYWVRYRWVGNDAYTFFTYSTDGTTYCGDYDNVSWYADGVYPDINGQNIRTDAFDGTIYLENLKVYSYPDETLEWEAIDSNS